MTHAEIDKFVQGLKSRQELEWLWQAAKLREQAVNAELASGFAIGDKVSFHGRKAQGTITGTVTGRSATTLKVLAESYSLFGQPRPGEIWNVAGGLLTRITKGSNQR